MKKKILFLTIAILALIMATSCGNKNLQRILVNINDMEPTIMEGSYIIADTSIHEFMYGDIVTYSFSDEYGISNTAGRIIGLPGDTIEAEGSNTIINKEKCKSIYIKGSGFNREFKETLPNGVTYFIYSSTLLDNQLYKSDKIPDGHYCIIGDFRDLAMDSRSLGAIPKEQITGKIVEII